MKAKVLSIALLIAAVLAIPAFARGTKDDSGAPAPGPSARGWNRPDVSDKKVELTGKVSFDDWHAELKTDKETVVLMVPGRYRSDIDVKAGDTIKVEGYLVTDAPCCADDNEKALLVTKAVVNGKEYEIDQRAWGPMAMGPGRGDMMRQPYGPPRGGMRGPGMRGPQGGPQGSRGGWR